MHRPNYVEDPSGILHYLAASPCQLALTECPALHGVASSALYHMTTRSITYDVVCFVVRDVTTSQSDANTVCTICNRAIVMLFTITVTDEFLLHTPMGTGSVAPEFNSWTRRCRVSPCELNDKSPCRSEQRRFSCFTTSLSDCKMRSSSWVYRRGNEMII